jgi:hypothetical protein
MSAKIRAYMLHHHVAGPPPLSTTNQAFIKTLRRCIRRRGILSLKRYNVLAITQVAINPTYAIKPACVLSCAVNTPTAGSTYARHIMLHSHMDAYQYALSQARSASKGVRMHSGGRPQRIATYSEDLQIMSVSNPTTLNNIPTRSDGFDKYRRTLVR